MASASEWNEQTMRRKEGSGEKEFNRAITVIWARIASREDGWKRTRSFRSVIKRVFDGGEGCDSAGTLVKSMESEGRDEERLWTEGAEGRARVGEADSAMVI